VPAGAAGGGHVEFGIVTHEQQQLRSEAQPPLDLPKELARGLPPAEFGRREDVIGVREGLDRGGQAQEPLVEVARQHDRQAGAASGQHELAARGHRPPGLGPAEVLPEVGEDEVGRGGV